MSHLRIPSLIFWPLVLLIGGLFLVACGKSPAQTPVATAGSQPPGSETSQPTPSSSNRNATVRPVASLNPCDSLGMFGSMAAGFSAQSAGASLDTSGTPKSKFAENIGGFAGNSLKKALNGNVSADCFMEFSSDGETGVWVALSLHDAIPSDAAKRVSKAMTDMNASVTGTMSSAAQGASFDLVTFESLPFDAPNGSALQGGLYFITSPGGAYMAVMMASYHDDSTPSSSGSIQNDGSTPEAMEAPMAVAPSGLAGVVNAGLEPPWRMHWELDYWWIRFFKPAREGPIPSTWSTHFKSLCLPRWMLWQPLPPLLKIQAAA